MFRIAAEIFVSKRKGKVISVPDINDEKITVQCERGHVWIGDVYCISKGDWCKRCANPHTIVIDDMREMARERGGICLSLGYDGSKKKLKWKCARGHEWSATADNAKETWCPGCNKEAAERATGAAAAMAVIMAIDPQLNMGNDILNIKEAAKPIMEPNAIVPAINPLIDDQPAPRKPAGVYNVRSNIEEMQRVAAKRNGTCLSTEYIGDKHKLLWKCEYPLHPPWEATPNNVKSHGSWCPECAFNINEELCRGVFEEAFPGKDFNKAHCGRTPWLNGLELDGYNDDLKLAFEYHGIQHYENTSHFHRTDGAFEHQLRRDANKKQYCDENKVKMVEIKYTYKNEKIREFIREQLVGMGYKISDIIKPWEKFLQEIKLEGTRAKQQLDKFHHFVELKGGTCPDATYYINNRHKLPVVCSFGHDFMASLEDIARFDSKTPRFCTVCGGTQKISVAEIEKEVSAAGFEFIDAFRANGRTGEWNITVICPEFHEITLSRDNFIKGQKSASRGCGICHYDVTSKSTRKEPVKWCADNKIQWIGDYKNNSTKCEWKCENGHLFIAAYNALSARTGEFKCFECLYNDEAKVQNLVIKGPCNGRVLATENADWECIIHKCIIKDTSRNKIKASKNRLCLECAK